MLNYMHMLEKVVVIRACSQLPVIRGPKGYKKIFAWTLGK